MIQPRQRVAHRWWLIVVALVAATIVNVGAPFAARGALAASSAAPAWQTTWTAPMDLATSATYESSVRDVAAVAVSGTAVKFTLSNLWSSTPTTFSAVSVGVQSSGATIVPGSIVPVTFNNGATSVTIAPYSRVTSDPVTMTVSAGESLAVTMAVSGQATVSVHFCCNGLIDSYATSNGVGNLTSVASASGFNPQLTTSYIRWLSAITVGGSTAQGTIVAFGDSITDGYGYTNNGFSWVNALQRRIDQLPTSERMSVVNEGIAGNTLTVFPPGTSFATTSGGLPGVTRLNRDALSLPGVKAVVLLLGTNDIWFGAGGLTGHPIPPYGTAANIEAGMRTVIAHVHARGLKIIGITLLPRSSSTKADHDLPETWNTAEQTTLNAVNEWMLSARSGFDAVVNESAVMSAVYNGLCEPTTPYAPYFNPDHLHPNVAGQVTFADAIPTTLFDLPQAPADPPIISATPTASCAGAREAADVLAAGTYVAPTTTSTTTAPTTTTTTVGPTGLRGTTSLIALALIVLAIVLTLVLWRRERARRRARLRRVRNILDSYDVPPGRRTPPRR